MWWNQLIDWRKLSASSLAICSDGSVADADLV